MKSFPDFKIFLSAEEQFDHCLVLENFLTTEKSQIYFGEILECLPAFYYPTLIYQYLKGLPFIVQRVHTTSESNMKKKKTCFARNVREYLLFLKYPSDVLIPQKYYQKNMLQGLLRRWRGN